MKVAKSEEAAVYAVAVEKNADIIARAIALLHKDLSARQVFSSPAAVKQYCQLNLAALEYEVFGVLFLDVQNRLIAYEAMFRGTLTQTSVYPGSEAASPQVWRADSFYVLAEWLIRGLGWAWLPRHVVQYPAYQNQMVELDSEWTPPALVVELVWRRDEPLGPAARFLAERFAECLQAID